MSISISKVAFGPEEEELVLQVMRSGQLAQGPMVAQLEQAFAPVAGCEHVVAVNSGTTALVAALSTLGVGPGDEVVTSPFTFVATLNAILEVGATARFADIGSDFTLDPQCVAEQINDRTAAILPVHIYGQVADMPTLEKLAADHGLALVEDAAQAHGATMAGRRAGSFGIGCFSLYATKNLTSGEGGLVTTNDASLADRLRLARNQGMRTRYAYEMVGHNYRLTDLQAALAIPQLARLAERNERRRRNAARLSKGLGGVPGLELPVEAPDRRHVWHQYTVRVTSTAIRDRDGVASSLAQAGIGTGVYYPRTVFDYDCYREHPQVVAGVVPNAEAATREVLSLPVHPWLMESDLDHIVATTRGVLGA